MSLTSVLAKLMEFLTIVTFSQHIKDALEATLSSNTSKMPLMQKIPLLSQHTKDALDARTIFRVLRENFMQMILFYGIPPLFSQMIWYYGIPPLRKSMVFVPKKNAHERTERALTCALKLLANLCDNNGMVINTAK
ncbi:unnamed protein product, partial [Rodentolepis nana]|uniref:Ras-GAP domain-containing protein n=1 Tax=Rodentolepis nana TaxID=102285 RepID=A0A0R3TJ05_RODNA